MKLYVISKINDEKIYLSLVAYFRQELAFNIGSSIFSLGSDERFHVNDVIAESDSSLSAFVGAIIGGCVGSLAGPIGIIIGASVGGVFGDSVLKADKLMVDNFNRSKVK